MFGPALVGRPGGQSPTGFSDRRRDLIDKFGPQFGSEIAGVGATTQDGLEFLKAFVQSCLQTVPRAPGPVEKLPTQVEQGVTRLAAALTGFVLTQMPSLRDDDQVYMKECQVRACQLRDLTSAFSAFLHDRDCWKLALEFLRPLSSAGLESLSSRAAPSTCDYAKLTVHLAYQLSERVRKVTVPGDLPAAAAYEAARAKYRQDRRACMSHVGRLAGMLSAPVLGAERVFESLATAALLVVSGTGDEPEPVARTSDLTALFRAIAADSFRGLSADVP